MSILTRWLLIPPVNARLMGVIAIIVVTARRLSARRSAFLDDPGLDFYSAGAPALAAYRAEHKNLYPHINASRPRPLARSVILFKHAGY